MASRTFFACLGTFGGRPEIMVIMHFASGGASPLSRILRFPAMRAGGGVDEVSRHTTFVKLAASDFNLDQGHGATYIVRFSKSSLVWQSLSMVDAANKTSNNSTFSALRSTGNVNRGGIKPPLKLKAERNCSACAATLQNNIKLPLLPLPMYALRFGNHVLR
jgi:hypothetical protein